MSITSHHWCFKVCVEDPKVWGQGHHILGTMEGSLKEVLNESKSEEDSPPIMNNEILRSSVGQVTQEE